MKQMSIVGRGYHSEENVIGFYNAGERIRFWGKYGAFWGSLWGLFGAGIFLVSPVTGPLMALGGLAVTVLSALEGRGAVIPLFSSGPHRSVLSPQSPRALEARAENEMSIFRGWSLLVSCIFCTKTMVRLRSWSLQPATNSSRAHSNAAQHAVNGKVFKMFGALSLIVLIPMLLGLGSKRLPQPKLAVVPIEQVRGRSPAGDRSPPAR